MMGLVAHPECVPCDPFRCWICAGSAGRGMRRTGWLGVTFVGQNRVRCPESLYVCEACVVCMAGKPPDTLRMTSHLVDGRGWVRLNKGGKAEMRMWLRGPKTGEWFAAIADTGQKHVLPWTPVNPARSPVERVLFEERFVTIGDWRIVDDATALLTAGATKEEIGRGEYGPRAWQLCGAALRAFEALYGGERGGGWFDLAVWLAQRDEVVVEARMTAEKEARDAERGRKGKAPKRSRGDAARDARGVPPDVGGERAETLGHPPVADEERGADKWQRGGVGDGHGPRDAARLPQCELFGGAPDAGGPRARAQQRVPGSGGRRVGIPLGDGDGSSGTTKGGA